MLQTQTELKLAFSVANCLAALVFVEERWRAKTDGLGLDIAFWQVAQNLQIHRGNNLVEKLLLIFRDFVECSVEKVFLLYRIKIQDFALNLRLKKFREFRVEFWLANVGIFGARRVLVGV